MLPGAPTWASGSPSYYSSGSNKGHQLSWNAPLSGGTVTGYTVYRSTDNSNFSLISGGTLSSSTTSYVDIISGHSNGHSQPTYYYQVFAINVCGSSPALSGSHVH